MAGNRAPDMRVKKTKKPKQLPKKPLIYMLAKGTPNEMGEPKGYPAEENAKDWAIKFIESHRRFCNFFNQEGNASLDAAIAEVQFLPVLLTGQHRTVTCLVDNHTGFTICVELWKERDG